MRTYVAAPVALLAAGLALGGHTRQGYVDGGQSVGGRYVVTPVAPKDEKKPGPWRYVWKDTKTGKTHEGALVGIPYGLDHFRVAYSHVFVAPDGETFAVWQPASWSPTDKKPPKQEGKLIEKPTKEVLDHPGFGDRLVVYKKTGEVLERLGMKDLLREDEWLYVNWVQGNLYWLREYADVMKAGAEPPRCGYRYYRVSPDYTVLEFTVGPNADAVHKVKGKGAAAVNYRRVVRVSLTDGSLLDATKKSEDASKVPGRPFVGDLVKRGGAQKTYVPSLDPVRVAGTYRAE